MTAEHRGMGRLLMLYISSSAVKPRETNVQLLDEANRNSAASIYVQQVTIERYFRFPLGDGTKEGLILTLFPRSLISWRGSRVEDIEWRAARELITWRDLSRFSKNGRKRTKLSTCNFDPFKTDDSVKFLSER